MLLLVSEMLAYVPRKRNGELLKAYKFRLLHVQFEQRSGQCELVGGDIATE